MLPHEVGGAGGGLAVRRVKGTAWDFFVGIIGVPNVTGLWQVADIRNNGTLKIKWVQAKRLLLRLKREDKMKPPSERRIPGGAARQARVHGPRNPPQPRVRPQPRRRPGERAHYRQVRRRPFTRVLLEHPEVVAGSTGRRRPMPQPPPPGT